jgi:hypothetical protein
MWLLFLFGIFFRTMSVTGSPNPTDHGNMYHRMRYAITIAIAATKVMHILQNNGVIRNITKPVIVVQPMLHTRRCAIHVDGNHQNPDTFPGSETGTEVTLGFGSYKVTEETTPNTVISQHTSSQFSKDCSLPP